MNKDDLTIPDILKAFETYDGVYKQYELDEALARQEEITPHLMEILEKVLADPEHYSLEENDEYAHMYAVMLLARFKETRAHEIIVKLFSLPGELPYDLFGSIVDEDLPSILYATSGGNWDLVQTMIETPGVREYCRAAALNALVYFVIFGDKSRDELIPYLDSVFTMLYEEEDYDELCFTTLVLISYDIHPEELMERINTAYDDGVISSILIDRESIRKRLKEDKAKVLEETKEKLLQRWFPEDFHEKMSWWSCFKSSNRYTASGKKILHTASEKNKHKRNKKKRARKKKKKA